MGCFDVCCAITGVSLAYGDATLVMLRRAPGGAYRPVALPVTGSYDSYGAIGADTDEANGVMITAFFVAETGSPRLFISDRLEWPPKRWEPTINDVIERNTTEWVGNASYHGDHGREPQGAADVTYDGDPIVYTLIARAVWEAITADRAELDNPAETFNQVFGGHAFPAGIYGAGLADVAAQLSELAMVDSFLTGRNLRWVTHTEGIARQGWIEPYHDDEDTAQWLHRARTEFADSPAVLAGLDRYHAEQQAWLKSLDEP